MDLHRRYEFSILRSGYKVNPSVSHTRRQRRIDRYSDQSRLKIYPTRLRWVWLGWTEGIKVHLAFRLSTYRLNELILNVLRMSLRISDGHCCS